MICPKCKCEYEEGYTHCSDCGVILAPNSKAWQFQFHINDKGISIVKYGLGLLFAALLQVIAVITVYEFYMVYRLSNGGVSGTTISNIHPLIWLVIIAEIGISAIVICWGANKKEKIE